MQLFRQQALDHRNRLHGEIFLVPPLRWQAISALLLAIVGLLALFLLFGSYSRTLTAAGVLRPAAGIGSVTVPEDGVVAEMLVRDGETVRRGQVIARLWLPHSVGGHSLAERRGAALAAQTDALGRQRLSAGEAVGESRQKLAQSIADELRQGQAIDAQIEQQRALIRSSEEELDRIKDVAERGFISGRDIQQRRELLIARKQGLAQLLQSRSQHAAALAAARIELGELGSRLRADLGGYDAQLAELRRETATLGEAGTLDLVASRDGILTALRNRPGDSLARGALFARIVPRSDDWQVELRVRTSAITQLAPGQEVRATLAAFPVADYGVLRGLVTQVGAAPVDGVEPYFLVTARLDRLSDKQRLRGVVLRPDLALNARIILDRRSFWQWLVDPIAAVSAR